MTGSAPPSGGSRGRPFLRPVRERSALHHDAPSRSGVPAALPQSQGLRPLSLVHLLLLADAKNPRRRLARTARSSAGGGPTTLRRVHRRTDMTMTRRRDHYLENLDATRCPYCHSQLCPDRAIGDDCRVDCGREPHDAEVPASAIRPGAGRPGRRPGCPVRGPRRCHRHLPPRPASQRWPSPPNPGTDNTSAGTATGRPRQDPGACWARRTRHALSINWDLPLERSAGSA